MRILAKLLVMILGWNMVKESNALSKPSFTSEWFDMESQTESSVINITHGLNDTPVKVIADVKVKEGDNEYIFRGMGGQESDDDESPPAYGGVLVLYNDYKVVLIAPYTTTHGGKHGTVIYTGSSSSWQGPNIPTSYKKAEVRVRVWIKCDLPKPIFISTWNKVSTDKSESLYWEIPHCLDSHPDLVNLQVEIEIENETFLFEGQGSSSLVSPNGWIQSSGAVFGYSNASFRIWFLKDRLWQNEKLNFIFAAIDGWGGLKYKVSSGQFRIIAWKFLEEQINVKNVSPYNENVTLPCKLQFDDMIVNAQFEVRSGTHAGFRFYGVGSAMNDEKGYGGMIYAITNSSVLMWIPKAKTGYTFNLWGETSFHQYTNNVVFRIEVIRLCNKEYSGRYLNESDNEIKNLMTETKQKLTVNKQDLSSTIRKRTSATDNRPSATGMGIASGAVLVVILVGIVIPDLPLLRRHFMKAWHDVRSQFRYTNNKKKHP